MTVKSLFQSKKWESSNRARQYFLEVAKACGDDEVLKWVSEHAVFEFTTPKLFGSPTLLGAAFNDQRGNYRIGLNKHCFGNSPVNALKSQFAAGHELGHLKQFLREEGEASMFTLRLYKQELQASKFALKGLTYTGRISIANIWDHRYRFGIYHHILALEATFPVAIHLLGLGSGLLVYGTWNTLRSWLISLFAKRA